MNTNTSALKQHVFDNSHYPIVIMNAENFQFIDCNEAAVEYYGFNHKEEVIGKSPAHVSAKLQYNGELSVEVAKRHIERSLSEGKAVFDWLHQRPNGQFWDAEVQLFRFDYDGIVYLQFSLIDITTRKLVEKKLRAEKLFNERLLDSFPGIFYLYDSNLKLKRWNRRHVEILGYSHEELLDMPIEAWHRSKEAIDFVKNSIAYVIENRSFNNIEALLYTKNNEVIPFLLSGEYFESGNGPMLMGIGVDITERKKIEEELKESEEMKNKLIAAIPDMIMQVDLENNILYVNEAVEKITGLKHQDFTQKDRNAKVHPDDVEMVRGYMIELLTTDKTHTEIIENRFIDTSGNIHWFSGTISKLFIKGKPILQLVSRDITEKKRIEDELENYHRGLEILVKERTEELGSALDELQTINEELQTVNNQLHQKNEIIHQKNEELSLALQDLRNAQQQVIQSEKLASLGILTAGVAHEINNPLNYLMGSYVGLTDYFNDYGSFDKQQTDILLNSINVGIDRISMIVKGLNQFSRTTESNDEECHIHAILDNCFTMLQNKIKYKARIVKEYAETDILIKANVGKMHQVFLNIITNAVDAITENGLVSAKTSIIQNFAVIEISDNGNGIEEEDLSRILDPFFTTKPPGQGTGLGLSISYSIIMEHNGSIKFESQKQIGTKVIVSLPIN